MWVIIRNIFQFLALEEEEEEEEEIQIWFKKTNLGIVVGKDHFGLQLLLIKETL